MRFYQNLTDLLNTDPEAYTLFYAQPPEVQAQLRKCDICCMEELRQNLVDASFERRPKIF